MIILLIHQMERIISQLFKTTLKREGKVNHLTDDFHIAKGIGDLNSFTYLTLG